MGHSNAVFADGVESAGDCIASFVVLAGMGVAVLPADPGHPYGHGRAEQVAASTVATLMFASGAGLLVANAEALLAARSQEPPASYTLGAIAASIVLKLALSAYKLGTARRAGSAALRADAWNDAMDVLSGLAVLGGILAARNGVLWADRAAALAVAVMILITAGHLYLSSGRGLLDEQAPGELLERLRGTALAVPGVTGVEKLLARRAGLHYFVDLHLEVPPEMPVREAHRIGHEVKRRLMEAQPEVADVLVHLEPHDPGRERV
jgi:cation diffusion facilitator family transporter